MAQSQSLNQTDATVFAQLVQRMLAEPDASISLFIVDMDDISEFLAQSGEVVFQPSDLTQNDFTRDFSLDQNLDRQS